MKTVRRRYRVARNEINYLSIIIGSYDGIAFLQTIDPNEAIIELGISPCCVELVSKLVDSFIQDEGIDLEEMLI
jgi:hypothetical protein